MLAHLCGSIDPACAAGSILFIEDVAEPPYRLERCLVQLLRCGWLKGLSGVVIGELTNCNPGPDGKSAMAAVMRVLRPLKIPIVTRYPAAHGSSNHPFIHGQTVELNANETGVTLVT